MIIIIINTYFKNTGFHNLPFLKKFCSQNLLNILKRWGCFISNSRSHVASSVSWYCHLTFTTGTYIPKHFPFNHTNRCFFIRQIMYLGSFWLSHLGPGSTTFRARLCRSTILSALGPGHALTVLFLGTHTRTSQWVTCGCKFLPPRSWTILHLQNN